jgi:hypothetical protein
MKEYLDKLLKVSLREVSFGYRTVTVFDEKTIEEAQIGYSKDDQGNNITGTGSGDWKSSWLVIASEDETGDPIFIDLDNPKYCVMTAMHGEGNWEPNIISSSFEGFIQALEEINKMSKGRSNPVELEENPLPENEISKLIDKISSFVKTKELEFWESWLES